MKLRKWTLIKRLIFDKKFTRWFTCVIKYALNNYEEKRGDGASDVLMYEAYYGRDILK